MNPEGLVDPVESSGNEMDAESESYIPVCGDNVVDEQEGETCDPPSSCPTGCDDEDPCTVDTKIGSEATCDVECVYDPVTECQDGDGCCLQTCDMSNDTDCWSPYDDDGDIGVYVGNIIETLCCGEMRGWTDG